MHPHLDKRQPRLLLGVDAQKLGRDESDRGGDRRASAHCRVRRARELEGLAESSPRVRARGGGGKKLAGNWGHSAATPSDSETSPTTAGAHCCTAAHSTNSSTHSDLRREPDYPV